MNENKQSVELIANKFRKRFKNGNKGEGDQDEAY